MRYGTVCSGIDAPAVAWNPLGWTQLFSSEIEPFPCAVLKHHNPDVPNLGDMTKFKEWPDFGTVDVIIGGTPCQSFSVAGLRKGLDDPRGNLALVYLGILDRIRPTWFIFENVPGLLSSVSHDATDLREPEVNLGRGCEGQEMEVEDIYTAEELHAFNCLLAGVSELGYWWAYRVLDAKHFGVPQRRRRIFVVGHSGSWTYPAAVLFERESVRWDLAPCREAREDVAGTFKSRARSGGWSQDVDLAASGYMQVSRPLRAQSQASHREDSDNYVVAHSLRCEGYDASEDGTGRGVPLVCGFAQNQQGEVRCGEVANTLNQNSNASGRNTPMVHAQSAVRRLTPTECTRLQGFPDDYLGIEYRGKPAADGPKYKALGNSMAVPVIRWLGERIEAVDHIADAGKMANSGPRREEG